ncbi:MAG TPA: DUF5667 domain-containing protein [Nocardioides sp.]|nr:DUF5667 domain-containing protein [Nocardioides sp.]
MTALFSARRRADEFAAAVDGRSRAVAEELRPLVSVATALREERLEAAAPRPEFAAELRALLMAEAERSLAPAQPLVLPPRPHGPRERRLAVAASVAVLLGGSAGMAAAAQSALPGEALYPIKRGIERAEAELSVSTAGRGEDLLRQADGRLAEVEDLLAGSPTASGQVPVTLQDFVAQAQEGAELMLASFEETSDPAAVVAVREFAASGIGVLQEIARTAPPEAQDELAAAAMALADIDARAAELCPSCGDDLPELQVPGIFLAAAEVDRAFALVTQRRLLDNSHPVVADRRLVKRATDSLAGLASGSGESTSSGSTSTGDEPASVPQEGPTSDALIDLPDGTGGADLTPSDRTVRKQVTDGTKDLTSGLSGAVETLLPDADLAP